MFTQVKKMVRILTIDFCHVASPVALLGWRRKPRRILRWFHLAADIPSGLHRWVLPLLLCCCNICIVGVTEIFVDQALVSVGDLQESRCTLRASWVDVRMVHFGQLAEAHLHGNFVGRGRQRENSKEPRACRRGEKPSSHRPSGDGGRRVVKDGRMSPDDGLSSAGCTPWWRPRNLVKSRSVTACTYAHASALLSGNGGSSVCSAVDTTAVPSEVVSSDALPTRDRR